MYGDWYGFELARVAAKRLDDLIMEGNWIPIKDRLPNWGQTVEVRHGFSGIAHAIPRLGYIQDVYGNNVPVWLYAESDMIAVPLYTHWRPQQEETPGE